MKRSKFSLSNTKLFSCDMGQLIPCGWFEVLPGDSIQQSTSMLVRASPLLAPVMHPVDVRLHHWFVPYRLVWEDFEDFITGGPDGLNASVFPTRTAGAGGHSVGSLPDFLGVPPQVDPCVYSVLPIRAYQLIWNEWYRDQDLQTPATISTASGPDNSTTSATLRTCQWEKDYFTSARPWEQKGPSITIPLGTSAPVYGIGVANLNPQTDGTGTIRRSGQAAGAWTNYFDQTAGVTSGYDIFFEADQAGASGRPNIRADLTSASAITINALREAMALQRYEEARARFGSRYVEYLRYLGVRSSDARLQRPEFLGGGRQTIQFSEVLQTTPTAEEPVGQLRGHGIAAMRSNRYRRYFEEHGVVMTLFSVRPKTIYMQGLKRAFNRRTKEDFWQVELQHIGQQEVLNKEIYAAHATPDGVFGFQNRYQEYREENSTVAGEFRTSSLNYWHLAREFSSSPALNSTFVSCIPTERVFAVPSEAVLWNMARHSIQARRLVSGNANSFIF